jgi:hypothetical protein
VRIPERKRTVTDYVFCYTKEDLKWAIEDINKSGFEVIAVTQDEEAWTVFFRRPAYA